MSHMSNICPEHTCETNFEMSLPEEKFYHQKRKLHLMKGKFLAVEASKGEGKFTGLMDI